MAILEELALRRVAVAVAEIPEASPARRTRADTGDLGLPRARSLRGGAPIYIRRGIARRNGPDWEAGQWILDGGHC